jgi:uncharacterized protein
MRRQVLVIHGGDFFDSREEFFASLKELKLEKEDLFPDKKKGWKEALQKDLGEDYEVLLPEMPLKYHARYDEWKVWLEKLIPYFKSGIILVGHSLGGIFLARYLSENEIPKKIGGVFFIAAPYFAAKSADENAGFVITESLSNLSKYKLIFYYSEDDEIISAAHAKKYKKELPDAEYVIYKDKGHFFSQKHFPELVEAIKTL